MYDHPGFFMFSHLTLDYSFINCFSLYLIKETLLVC